MKFSVLLPTRNRLEYLRYAIETVQRQDFDDWEIIVSDNCSEDDIAGYVHGLGDARIRYFRTDRFVPVTDNWNAALGRSTGDYVVMLGDDDGLLPGYFSTLLKVMEEFADPDFAYVSALFYAYPGVMPGAPTGFLKADRNAFEGSNPFWLDAARARSVTKSYLDFRMPVASNMQFSLISRRKIETMSRDGPFFQSPYPDFFATPALFLTSTRILICPLPLVVIGITPKSYGFFHFNNRAADGVKFLNNDAQLDGESTASAQRLPGTSYNDSWLLANEALYRRHAAGHGLRPNYGRYRFLQIVHGYKKRYLDHAISKEALSALRARMNVRERIVYGVGLPVAFSVLALMPTSLRDGSIARLRRLIGQLPMAEERPGMRSFANLVEVFDSMDGQDKRFAGQRAVGAG